ncbi:MAG: hypothetical protein APF76_04630 [Desulfitibacter sp. BRH_c19]|nr:MAG: hypothetical protein APF76_04630 [Desulfitibacter sp. BRH_c19]
MFKKLTNLYNSYLRYRQTKRLELMNHYIDLSSNLKIANKELTYYLEGYNEYFTFSAKNIWINKYQEAYFSIKRGNKYRKISLDKESISTIDDFKQNFKDINQVRDDYNKQFIEIEKTNYRVFFNDIEGKSLDEQQVECVVKDEVNNLVIAGAGSGKTTTIVGKVKYLLSRYKYDPKTILVLSFTNASATEMAERIRKETNVKIDVMTFHKLGKEIIAEVEGKQPDITRIELNNFIKEKFNSFRKVFDYMYLVNEFFLSYLKEYKSKFEFKNDGEYIEYLLDNQIKTLKNETVKSYEEMEIANFLFTYNINYEYESYYEVNTADQRYSRYKPDFYLPDYNIYIEHYGIDREGNVPDFFTGDGELSAKEKYNSGINWKRVLHKTHNTVLIETYSYEKMEGNLTKNLRNKLLEKGVEFKPKTVQEMWSIIEQDKSSNISNFISLINTFINLIRAGGYTISDLKTKNNGINWGYERMRNDVFLDIVEPIYTEYINELDINKEIDFSDMINKAISYVEDKKIRKRYKYIVVDEYQDISKPRYRLIKALRDFNDSKLFCVGDDWQSIYRFAGSDISLFTNFHKYFGYTESSYIETTYRFNKNLIDVSSKFILKNKSQIKKKLKSFNNNDDRAIEILYGDTKNELVGLIKARLNDLPENATVLLLGRYKEDIRCIIENDDFVLQANRQQKQVKYNMRSDLKMEYLTVHSSKGLQGDYVFILNNSNKKLGFPSNIADDKVLNLIVEDIESCEHAEERRLFYVALTRAKKTVFLTVENNSKSKFIKELEKDTLVSISTEDVFYCPSCKKGQLNIKKGPYGLFYGCSNYPLCQHTEKYIKYTDSK